MSLDDMDSVRPAQIGFVPCFHKQLAIKQEVIYKALAEVAFHSSSFQGLNWTQHLASSSSFTKISHCYRLWRLHILQVLACFAEDWQQGL